MYPIKSTIIELVSKVKLVATEKTRNAKFSLGDFFLLHLHDFTVKFEER